MNREIPRTEAPTPVRHFTAQLSATRRGARLARMLATEQLRSWELPFDAAAHLVAELAANAVLHGRVPARDFRLGLFVTEYDTLRIEVTDARDERVPSAAPEAAAAGNAEAGRGLLLVEALADRWGVVPGSPPCKIVWAELAVAPHPSGQDTPRPSRGCRGAEWTDAST
ncbi:ATP-binding protein [Streptomyces sp. 8N616]|uniref:ATP-binding protein n=1 Tax=Streptomyces sp. 8N616 TaxID=3457414 RepID=UPI003FD1C8C5